LGGDEFAILAVECDGAGAQALVARLADAFLAESIDASLACEDCRPGRPFSKSWQLADERMYDCKRGKRRRRDCALSG
jgi:GGDEF domain-containing protein